MSRLTSFGKRSHAQQIALATSTCVLYIRASTPDQVNSLDAQRKRAAEFAAAKGLTIAEIFVDSGVSAVKHSMQERPQARQLFAYIRKHSIATILVLRLDRAFRSSLDFSLTTKAGLEQGFHFRFIDPDIDYGTPMGRMFAGMEALRAEMEGELRSQRVNDAYDILRDQRIMRSNQAGYGWQAGPPSGTFARISGKPLLTLVPVPHEQAILREMMDRYQSANGRHGILQEIANLLNHHNIPTKTPAGTIITRTKNKGTPRERTVTTVTDGTWKPFNVRSVLAHAVIAEPHEMPDNPPTFSSLTADHPALAHL